jgi:hypothetical protein
VYNTYIVPYTTVRRPRPINLMFLSTLAALPVSTGLSSTRHTLKLRQVLAQLQSQSRRAILTPFRQSSPFQINPKHPNGAHLNPPPDQQGNSKQSSHQSVKTRVTEERPAFTELHDLIPDPCCSLNQHHPFYSQLVETRKV